MRRETPAPDGLRPKAYRTAGTGGLAITQALMAKELEETKEQMGHWGMRLDVSTSARHYVSQDAKVARLAEVAGKRAKAPKLKMNQTAEEWDRWRSSWAKYKRYNRPTEHHGSFSHAIATVCMSSGTASIQSSRKQPTKVDTGLTEQRNSVYSLWGFLTRKFEMQAYDAKLEKDAYLNEDKK